MGGMDQAFHVLFDRLYFWKLLSEQGYLCMVA